MICGIHSYFMMWIFEGGYIPDLYDLAHAAGWDPCDLHDLGRVSWVRCPLDGSCTASRDGRLGSR